MSISKRVIPILTIDNNRLVKTLKFKRPKYIGDPINALKIFNTKMVDELVILDISRNRNKRELEFDFLSKFIGEAFMPIAYGGGIKNIDQVKKLFSIGYDRVVFNSTLFKSPNIISQTANLFGSQAVMVSIDFKKLFFSKYKIFSNSGRNKENINIEKYLRMIESNGAGEVFLNSIDKDGTFGGYDIELIQKISNLSNLPIIACGGARNFTDFDLAINKAGASAVAAGSCFVFNKQSRDSVLISY